MAPLSESSRIKESSRSTSESALDCISNTLSRRLGPHATSDKPDDVCEAVTAAVYLMSSASNPSYVSKESRRLSFERGHWHQLGRSQTVDDMVESGFFYLQEDDHVKCFFCDLGLKDWDVGDVPEMEHARFSPLCFFLKSSRGLDWLRGASQRPPNFPSSYTRQDHNQLLKLIHAEMNNDPASVVSKLGFSKTKVLLCIARKFIRFRQKYEGKAGITDLLKDLQREWDLEMSGETVTYIDEFDLAGPVSALMERMKSHAAPSATSTTETVAARTSSSHSSHTTSSAPMNNKCRNCNSRDVEIVCLPCGHLSLCGQCAKTRRTCPAVNCGDQVDNMVRAFLS